LLDSAKSSARPTNKSDGSWRGWASSARSRGSSTGTNANSPKKLWSWTDRAREYGERAADLAHRVDADRHERSAWFGAHGRELIELSAATLELNDRDDQARERRINEIRRDPPAWVTERLGPRPHDHAAREQWDRAAAHLDDYRTAFGQLPGDELPGRADYRQRHAWEDVHKAATKALEMRPERPLAGRPSPEHHHDIGLGIGL
jgi:hypothetical protein